MEHWFEVEHLDVERLLARWRWLCPGPKTLVARSAFGDLFLKSSSGEILRLNVSTGELEGIAESESRFLELTEDPNMRDKWFGEADEREFAAKGLVPSKTQCIAFDIPLVFKEAAVRKPYLLDVYENVSFLGDLNVQIAGVPNGGKVKLIVGRTPH